MKQATTILFCFLHFFICAQNKMQSWSVHNLAYDYPFDSIIFHDVRFDTTSVGVTNKMGFFSDVNQSIYIKLQPSLPGFLNALINNSLVAHHNANNDKLICYIKKFRLTELNSTYQVNAKKERQLQIRAAIEAFYFYKNKLYPAFKTDTSFLQSLSENKTTFFIIDSLLHAFTKKASKINKEKILKKKSYSAKSVDSIYRLRFNLPILSATSFNKGVYRSSKEFFNNAPSISEFEWKREKKVNILYTKDENNQFMVSKKEVFGFCDGKISGLRWITVSILLSAGKIHLNAMRLCILNVLSTMIPSLLWCRLVLVLYT